MTSTSGADPIDLFAERLKYELVDNNVLRGAWAEQVVAHFLEGWRFPGQWHYCDLCDEQGHTLSVKHSTGEKARFDVQRKPSVWDNELARSHGNKGWRGCDQSEPQYWCDVYVFAWLDDPLSLDRVLNPLAWRFAVLSRAGMYRAFTADKHSIGLRVLIRDVVRESLAGEALADAVAAAIAEGTPEDIPPLDMTPYEELLPLRPKGGCPSPQDPNPELSLDAEAAVHRPLQSLIESKRDEIKRVVTRHKGQAVAIFGSVARGEEAPDSDVDVLVQFEKGSSLFDLMHVEDELVELLGCEVDVVSVGGLKRRDHDIRRDAVWL